MPGYGRVEAHGWPGRRGATRGDAGRRGATRGDAGGLPATSCSGGPGASAGR